jgi:hypothetical protein
MKNVEYGPSITGEFFQFVHEVCATELGVSMELCRTMQWTASPDIFAGYLALNPVQLKLTPSRKSFRVSQFCLRLDGGDTMLELDDTQARLDNDPFTQDILASAQKIFAAHAHEQCIAEAEEQERVRKALTTPIYRLRSAKSGEILIP